MTNTEIRVWYRQKVGEIPRLNNEWTEQGYRLEERARRAWRIRHEARNQARSMMENSDEVEDLMERDRRLYGHSDGPSFEQLVAEHRWNVLATVVVYNGARDSHEAARNKRESRISDEAGSVLARVRGVVEDWRSTCAVAISSRTGRLDRSH